MIYHNNGNVIINIFLLYDKNKSNYNSTLFSKIELRSYNSITEIDKRFWDGLANNIFNSWDFLLCLEKAKVENSQMKYLIFFNHSIQLQLLFYLCSQFRLTC